METIVGVVERQTVTLKLRDGTTRTFKVRGGVNLDYADDGDEVRITLDRDRITSIRPATEKH